MALKLKKNKTVVVAMSGGVDSSVAAALLLEEGYDVIGVTMKTYDFDAVGGNVGNETGCCGLDAFNDARMVAAKLGIPHYVVDFTAQFEREVVGNFVDEYLRGRTPNPCVLCNRMIKWGELIRKAEALGADLIATGHYARVGFDESLQRFYLATGLDARKDQSYALWGLSQYALSKTLFPIGRLTKPEVRRLAAQYGLKTAEKGESFEICFVADNDYRRFVHERVPGSVPPPGNIVRDGKVVGMHDGFWHYTIGQRSGIGAHGERVYVTEIDGAGNTVRIGRDEELYHRSLSATALNLVSVGEIFSGMRLTAKIRYKDDASPGRIYFDGGDRFRILFDLPKRAISPGQSVVLYDGDHLLGGGIIEGAAD
jgi:tRNA-specific 2-thiouridylase